MIKIGITGSIGSGKSTLARKAGEELGIPVFDADKAVHDLYAKDEELKNFLMQKYGAAIVQNGKVDRKALKAFMDDKTRQKEWQEVLAEVHRRVWGMYGDFIQKQKVAGQQYIIADVPFLFETAAENHFDYTVNVFLPYEAQKRRALERETPKLTEAEFEQRYRAFMSIEKRNQRADFTVDNSGEIAASVLQLRAHMKNMRDPGKPASLPKIFNQAAVYVGSFDPMTLGHVDVVKSAAKMPYSKLYVAIGVNPKKQPLFTTEERLAMIEREMDRDVRPHLAPGQEIIVTSYEGLTVDFMKSVGSSFCVRGLRGIKDLEEEGDLAAVNKGLYADGLDEPDTGDFSQAYFATSNPELRHVSSSFARALCASKKDISLLRYVSADVAAKMIAKRQEQELKLKSGKIYRIPTPEELDRLKSLWKEFAPDCNGSGDRIYAGLLEKYSEPHRAYHNAGHLVELFEYFEEYRDQFKNPQAVVLALFFHDDVYNIPGPDNEKQSAEYARQALTELGVDPQVVARVADLIEMTKTHQPPEGDRDAALMLDMDMAILGAPAEKYKKYSEAIEAEYTSHFSAKKYHEGRLGFLESFRQKGRLFMTDAFEDRFGKQVCWNIADEHARLKAKPAQQKPPQGPK